MVFDKRLNYESNQPIVFTPNQIQTYNHQNPNSFDQCMVQPHAPYSGVLCGGGSTQDKVKPTGNPNTNPLPPRLPQTFGDTSRNRPARRRVHHQCRYTRNRSCSTAVLRRHWDTRYTQPTWCQHNNKQ